AGDPAPLELNGLRHGIVFGPEANWLVYDGGAGKTRLEQLRLVDQAMALQLANAREQTVAGVTKTYLAAAKLERQLELAAENIELSNARLARAERDTRYGQVNSLRRLQAQVDLNTDSAAYRNLILQVDNLKRSLNELMGRAPETLLSLSVPSTLRPRQIDYVQLEEDLLFHNEDLAQARHRIKQSEQELQLAGTAWKPNVQLYANASYFNQTDNANFLLENRAIGTQAGVRVSYSLYDGGARSVQKQQAKISIEQRNAEVTAVTQQLKTLLRQALATYDNARVQLRLEQANLPTFELNFTKTEEDFRLGQVDATVLRTAQLNLNAAKTRIALLEFGVREAEVELLRLTGRLVE
ncbi:MAG: TolC family protein, partial [Bacteroidota bacterium]